MADVKPFTEKLRSKGKCFIDTLSLHENMMLLSTTKLHQHLIFQAWPRRSASLQQLRLKQFGNRTSAIGM